jgi:acetyltransferase
MKPYAQGTGKPILSCFMGGAEVAAANEILNRAGIPTFQFPDTATRAFVYMWRYSYNLRGLYETPVLRPEAEAGAGREAVAEIIRHARSQNRTLLTEYESKQLLGRYGIPAVETRVATSPEQAARHAEELGFPVAVKVHSETVTHKARVGGVRLHRRDASAVRAAFAEIEASIEQHTGPGNFLGVTVQPMIVRDGIELIVGSNVDPQFGPVLLFGSGGRMVEVHKDRALALPPLNTTLARRMMEQTRVFKELQQCEEKGQLKLQPLEALLVRFSHLVTEQPWIKEIDINPLLISEDGLMGLDARVVLHPATMKEEGLPRPAVRPYPSQHVQAWTMKDGGEILIRPIRPEDEPLMTSFHEHLSDRTVYMRYFQPLKLTQRTAHERLTRICFIDYDREMALVAEKDGEIIAVGRLSKLHGKPEAEVAVLVRDDYQHRGIGTELVRRLMIIAKEEKLQYVHSTMLGINREMRAICNRLGFALHQDLEDDLVNARVKLE